MDLILSTTGKQKLRDDHHEYDIAPIYTTCMTHSGLRNLSISFPRQEATSFWGELYLTPDSDTCYELVACEALFCFCKGEVSSWSVASWKVKVALFSFWNIVFED